MSCTNKKPSQTNTNLNTTANLSQTFYQPHTAPNIGPTANLHSSTSVLNEKPVNSSPIITQKCTVRFVAMNISVKTFDGVDDHKTTEELLHQNDPHMIFIRETQLLHSVTIESKAQRKQFYL